MKKLLKSLIISLIIIIIMSGVSGAAHKNTSSKIVMDIDSGRVLYEENSDEKRPIASLTKILTCITAIENLHLDSTVVIEDKWTNIEGSSIYLKENECLTVEELLYGLMLRSGNDAATAICGFAEKQGLDFISLMIKTAGKAGAGNSSFENPHGLDSKNHFSTAKDLALISSYALKSDVFRKIVATRSKKIGSGESERTLINKNKLLTLYPYANGLKTGYTKKSGRCLASSATKNGMNLVCIVLNEQSTYETTEKLFEKCFNDYKNVVIQSSEEPVAYFRKAGKSLPCYTNGDVIYPLKADEQNRITKKVKITYDGGFPVSSDTEMGLIEFYLKNQLLFTQKIYNIMS